MADENVDKGTEKQTVEEAGAKGGRARAKSLSPEDRRKIAQKASEARWAKEGKPPTGSAVVILEPDGSLPVATHRGFLNLMDFEVPCYVLDNRQKVIGRTSFTETLTKIKGGGDLEKYLGVNNLKPFINLDLVLEGMVAFRLPEVEGLETLVEADRWYRENVEAAQLPSPG